MQLAGRVAADSLRARAAVKKHPEYNEHEYLLAVGTASKLSLLRGTLGRRVRRQRDPGVT